MGDSPIWVTGCAGFIGSALALDLLKTGHRVVGIDSMSPYYDVTLKRARLERLRAAGLEQFFEFDLSDATRLRELARSHRPGRIVHLAAQAGVRYSVEHPESYIQSNLVGFANVLEVARHAQVSHLLYASTSSVYGSNTTSPFSPEHGVDHPISLYAATKRANELMAHSYSSMFGLPTTGVRFFTVYGPWGRPDMALFKFTRAILRGEPIEVFNGGKHRRDFTYIDDVVAGLRAVLHAAPPTAGGSNALPNSSSAPYRLYNLGGTRPVELEHFIATLERALGKRAERTLLPMQLGDVEATSAEMAHFERDFGFKPSISVEQGIPRFVDWYRSYYPTDAVSAGAPPQGASS